MSQDARGGKIYCARSNQKCKSVTWQSTLCLQQSFKDSLALEVLVVSTHEHFGRLAGLISMLVRQVWRYNVPFPYSEGMGAHMKTIKVFKSGMVGN